MSTQLITINKDCDLTIIENNPQLLAPLATDDDLLIELFHEFGFRTFLREITNDPDAEPEGGRRHIRRKQSTPSTGQGQAEAAAPNKGATAQAKQDGPSPQAAGIDPADM